MIEFLQWVAGAGFAIAVAGYLLIKIEPAMKDLTTAIAKLTGVIEKCEK